MDGGGHGLLTKSLAFLFEGLPDLRLVDDNVYGVYNMAAFPVSIAQHIGEILVEHFHIVNKIVETATVLKPVPSHYAVILYLDFPTVHLGLLQKVDKTVLVGAVIVEGELKRLAGSVHTSLGQIQTTVP